MALVDYSSSNEEDEQHCDEQKPSPDGNEASIHTNAQVMISTLGNIKPHQNSLKSKHYAAPSSLPPLPSKFLDLYASNARASTRDDPSFHGGRIRTTPHIQGNWPTHLYIEWYPNPFEHGVLASLVDSFHSSRYEKPLYDGDLDVQSLLTSDLGSPLPLHISLSRPIGFSTATKDAFLASLQEAISSSNIRPFCITFNGCRWASNFEGTRWFLALRVAKPLDDNLNRLLRVCNDTVQSFGQPPLYSSATSPDTGTPTLGKLSAQSPSLSDASFQSQDLTSAFHVSIAWALSAPPTASIASSHITPGINQLNANSTPITASEVKAKIGNVVTSISLPTEHGERSSLFGL